MKEIRVSSKQRNEMIDITNDVEEIVQKEKIEDGFVIIYVPHTTAGVTINEGADPDVQRDIVITLKKLIPESGDYHHSEGNSDAHIKSSIIGPSQVIPIENGKLQLGRWQNIGLAEFDGPRERRIIVKIL